MLAERARVYLNGRVANAELPRREVLEIDDQLIQSATQHSIEATAWKLAVENEARRQAEALKPKHKAAVRKIAQLVEQLSAAVEQERGIRRELDEVDSSALVNASYECDTLAEYGSLLSTWNRRLLA